MDDNNNLAEPGKNADSTTPPLIPLRGDVTQASVLPKGESPVPTIQYMDTPFGSKNSLSGGEIREERSGSTDTIEMRGLCRICLDQDTEQGQGALLRVCKCDSLVHNQCLNNWIARSQRPYANKLICEVCQTPYSNTTVPLQLLVNIELTEREYQLAAQRGGQQVLLQIVDQDSAAAHARAVRRRKVQLILLVAIILLVVLLFVVFYFTLYRTQ